MQIMAFHLFGAKPLLEPVLTYSQSKPNWNTKFFSQENLLQIVICITSAIVFSPQ